MPGFSAGMANVSRDEQRHIGFGVKALSEMFAESEECKAAVVELLREVLPYSLAVFIPPGWDERYTTSLRVHARGHLRLRHALDRGEVAGGRLPARGDARRRLPGRPLPLPRRSAPGRRSCC